MTKVIAVPGSFDPLHVGHIRLLEDAARYGEIMVILHSDNWLLRNRGYIFMSFFDRREILNALKYISEVVQVDDADNTVCEALYRFKPDYFSISNDKVEVEMPEKTVCEELGIEIIVQEPSDLVRSIWLKRLNPPDTPNT